MKRQDYLSWDAYFMGVAMLSAERSKDNNTQVGSCIVSPHNKILSMGYNGMPTGCDDDRMPWERRGTPLDTKYLYVCHAELNAILNYSGVPSKVQGSIQLFSRVTSVRRRSSRPAYPRSFIIRISMPTQIRP